MNHSKQNNSAAIVPWIVFDGRMVAACVEPLYLLSGDTADNHILALANGDHIDMGSVKVIFETTSLVSIRLYNGT